eukprot:NODE_5103_length_983_cov_91.668605_g4894_i0.p1 GENE.NODE_5103_length_983_cov_91.668605_g4894_i0~~NODE_5103_length_983_cov_91.668605_g4894_i0.p1  ORF type:complete len:273 (+),score=72.10 NODE_5103_length_983_cov_91.668605_g4894_i0:51-821(+)
MGEALIRGMLQSGFLANASDAVAFDPYPPQREKLKTQLGITVVTSNIDVVKQVQWVILCVKPNTVGAVFKEIAPVLTPDHLIISICAGVTIQTLSAGAGTNRVVRVMPNTPCMVGQSASGFACAEGVTEPEKATILRMLQSVGVAVEVAENLLDAVTGVSGSGPAYVALFIEAMADGGVRAGLPRPIAEKLAAQTVLGTATMVLQGKGPADVKNGVTSPGGTTIEAVHQLEVGGFRASVMNAVHAASEKSKALSRL